MNATQRPPLFSFGIVATAILAMFMMCLIVFVAVVGAGASIFGMLSAEEAILPLGIAAGVGGMILIGMLIYHSLVLVSCFKAWNGSRGWTIALIVFSALGLINFGLFSFPIQILTIIGGTMALAQERDPAHT